MKKAIFAVSALLISFLSGCAIIKTPSITNTDKDEGQILTSYSYGLFEKPNVKTDITLSSVNAQCKGWGYEDAKHTEGPEKRCISKDPNGNIQDAAHCIEWQVFDVYQCNLNVEQRAAINAKRQEQLKQEVARQEQTSKEAAARSANNRKENVDKTSWCASTDLLMSKLMGELGELDVKSKFEGYSLVMAKTSMELGSYIGLTNKELVAINQKNIKLIANGMRGKTAVGINEYLNENFRSCLNFVKANDEVRTLVQKYTNQ